MGISGGNSCHCKTNSKDTNLLAPLRGKMKVLKKIKRRMGLVPRSSSGSNIGTNNLPPLLFHQVHGDNIRLSRDGTIAKRVESFCKGITFSARPVKINEKVCIKFIEISNNWNGVIRFGFTYNNPADNVRSLPKYACPDLTNKPGYWAKALAERFCERDTVLFYYVTSSGEVHFGINGEEKGVFFSGVETRGPLWALIDVYGNSTAIQFIDVRQNHLNNSTRTKNYIPPSNSCDNTPEDIDRLIVPMQGMHIQQHQQGNNNPHNVNVNITTATNEDRDRDASLLPLRNQAQGLIFHPVPLHRTRGRNVRFSSDRCIASRNDAEFCQGYVFTARPIQLGERFVVQILATETMYVGALALGLTSCDPATLQLQDLPDDSDLLLDRPEYWVVSKDVAASPQRGDELNFCVTLNGEVQISKNGGSPTVVMHVDQTLKLWAFLDIYGSTQKIRVLSSPPATTTAAATPSSASPVRSQASSRCNISSESTNNINGQTEARRNMNTISISNNNMNSAGAVPAVPAVLAGSNSSRVCCVSPNDVQFQSGVGGGGAVIVVNLPATHATNLLNHQQQNITTNSNNSTNSGSGGISHSHSHNSIPPSQIQHHSSHSSIPQVQVAQPMVGMVSSSSSAAASSQPISCSSTGVPGAVVPVLPSSTGTMLSTYSSTYIEPISSSSNNSIYNTIKTRSDLTLGLSGSAAGGVECTICYENPIDSVLYMCGHMCMCYNCAVQQWRGKGGGHCPLCRAVIRDVIRTYKS